MKYYATTAAVAALVMGAALTEADAQETLTQNARAAGIVEMDGRTMDELAEAKAERAEAEEADEIAAQPLAREEVLAEVADDFAAADTDGDDALSAEEYVAALEPDFETDASLSDVDVEVGTETELAATETETEVETAEPDTIAAQLTAKFTAIAGEDGTLSADELAAATEADFEAADEDGDDALDAAEAQVFASLKTGRTAS